MSDVISFKDGTLAMPSRSSDKVLPTIRCQCCIHIFQTLALEIALMLNNPLQPCWRRRRHRVANTATNDFVSSSMPSGNAASRWKVVMQRTSNKPLVITTASSAASDAGGRRISLSLLLLLPPPSGGGNPPHIKQETIRAK
jgi:hypothetical protein